MLINLYIHNYNKAFRFIKIVPKIINILKAMIKETSIIKIFYDHQ